MRQRHLGERAAPRAPPFLPCKPAARCRRAQLNSDSERREHLRRVGRQRAAALQNATLLVYDRDGGAGPCARRALPQPVRGDLEVGQPLETDGIGDASHENGGKPIFHGHRKQHRLSGIERPQLRLGRLQCRVAAGQETVSIHDDHGFERPGIDHLLAQRGAVVPDVTRRQHLHDGLGGAEARSQAARMGLARIREPLFQGSLGVRAGLARRHDGEHEHGQRRAQRDRNDHPPTHAAEYRQSLHV